MITKSKNTEGYSVHSSNQAMENISFRAITKVYGKQEAEKIAMQYSRAPVTIQTLIDDFGKFDNPYVEPCTMPAFTQALSDLTLAFDNNKFHPVHFCDVPLYKWNLSTSVGEPYCLDSELIELVSEAHASGLLETPRLSKKNVVNYVLLKTRPTVHNIKEGKLKTIPSSWITRVLARSHLSTPDNPKVRAVYAVPFPILLIECIFFWPIIAYLKESTKSPILWGYETTRGGAKRIFHETKSDDIMLQIDWKSFDKYIPFWLISAILDLLINLFDLSTYVPSSVKPEYSETSANPTRLRRLFEFIRESYFNSRIRTPDGATWKLSFCGLLSGCFGTQLIGSLANYIIITTSLKILGLKYRQVKVQGDDSFSRLTLGYKISPVMQQLLLDLIARTALKHFGLILSITKSRITDDPSKVIVLSYGYDGQTYREKSDLLGKLLYPERRLTVESTKSRSVGIAIANFGKDYKIYEVCKDIYYHLHNVQISKDLYLNWYDEEILELRKFLARDIFPTFEETFLNGNIIQYPSNDHNYHSVFSHKFIHL